MAIAMTFRGFNDLGCSVTLIFLSMGHFLYQFPAFCEKMKNLSSSSLNVFLAVRQFHVSLRVKVCENDGTI